MYARSSYRWWLIWVFNSNCYKNRKRIQTIIRIYITILCYSDAQWGRKLLTPSQWHYPLFYELSRLRVIEICWRCSHVLCYSRSTHTQPYKWATISPVYRFTTSHCVVHIEADTGTANIPFTFNLLSTFVWRKISKSVAHLSHWDKM